ncbi:hypothetical protein Poly30_08720 [Planctomycetes bacterium Poly30]|uniref:Peptidase S54 rhomboid domain-containing protein n=1 Tax=Saltatorellus ferox TaxID=2528018 RepID=A0A518EMR4_9BACT|nr:hypothetical protein Poly30_08720 [Planctomycetes bacterium Poly30]
MAPFIQRRGVMFARATETGLWSMRVLAALAAVLLATAASAFPGTLQLERAGLANGEWWRLWTGHLVHGSADHLVYDAGAAALLFVALKCPLASACRLLWMAPAISLALLAALPDLDHYYGLSGLLHGWAVAGTFDLWRSKNGPGAHLAAVFGIGTVLKAAWETWSGAAPFSDGLDMGGPVIHAAHLVGAIVGVAAAVATHRVRFRPAALVHTSTMRALGILVVLTLITLTIGS